MKIAMVAQHATLLHPRNGAGPRPEDAGVRELTRVLAHQGHQVTVYTQKHRPDEPDHAEIDGVRIEQIPAGPVGTTSSATSTSGIRSPKSPSRLASPRSSRDA